MKFLLSLALVLVVLGAFLWPAYSQPIRLVAAHFSDSTGAPLSGQPLIVEQTKASWEPNFSHFWFATKVKTPVKLVGVTDLSGFIQFVDLPAGEYNVKLVRAGQEPLTVKKFVLDSYYKNVSFKQVIDFKPKEGVLLEDAGASTTNAVEPGRQ